MAFPPVPVDAEVVVTGPLPMRGLLAAASLDATAVLTLPEGHGGPDASQALLLTLHGATGSLRLVSASREVVDTPLAGDVRLIPDYHTDVVALRDATLTVRASQPGFLALLLPVADAPLRLDVGPGDFAWFPTARADRFVAGGGDAYPAPYTYAREVPAGALRLALAPGDGARIGAAGALEVVLDNVTLEVDEGSGPQAFLLGRTERTQTEALGTRLVYQRNTTFAVLTLEHTTVELDPATEVAFVAPRATVDLEGRLSLPAASGRVRAGEAWADAASQVVVLEGRLHTLLEPADSSGPPGSSPGTRIRVTGEGTRAAVAGAELLQPPADLGPVVPAAVALAAALVAWLSGAAGKGLTFALLPATTALPPGTVLDHPRRRDIYQAVLARPGVHLRELQRLTGIRWASLQYHIAVLAGTGMLRRTQVGRHTVLSCDVHGLNEAQLQALHVLRGPRAAQVAGVIAKAAPLTQADIAAATGLSPRTVNRYLRLLLELALVEAASEASRRARRYTPTPRLAQLMPELHEPRTPAGPVP